MIHQRLLKRNSLISQSRSMDASHTLDDNHGKKDHRRTCNIGKQNKQQLKQQQQQTTTSEAPVRLTARLRVPGTKRILFFSCLFFFLCGMYMAHIIVLERSGMTDVDLLNELLDKSKHVYETSKRYSSRQHRNTTTTTTTQTRPGYRLRQEGAKATYPVVMVPGFITSGLELWDGEECARNYFRQRLWGSLPVFVQSFFTDNECWRRHLSLDPKTGLDPENIRLRSAQGFEATDYVMSTFWVWEKVIENLADVGYDPSNMIMMPYDWRLSFTALEERDGYLTKLQSNIEAMVKTSGKKVVLTSHSMGSQIILFFFKWVTTSVERGGGGGGKDWVERHIHSFVNIAGPILGVPKAVTALLSGEMKDTAAIMGAMGSMVERIFGRYHRTQLWRTWGSVWHMLPLGGDPIWSQSDDIIRYSSYLEDTSSELGSNTTNNHPLITFEGQDSNTREEWSLDDSLRYLKNEANDQDNSKFAIEFNSSKSTDSEKIESWHDPTTTPLPFAPSMKIYCLYGVGIETERSYYYKRSNRRKDDLNLQNDLDQKEDNISTDEEIPFVMDTSVNDAENNVRFGVQFSDGDVSVPLVSLGYMCVDGWKNNRRLNPSDVEIVTREYLHREEFRVNDPMRGGPNSADHVDILGNFETTLDLLKVATDFSISTINKNNIHSNIMEIASKVSARSDLKCETKIDVSDISRKRKNPLEWLKIISANFSIPTLHKNDVSDISRKRNNPLEWLKITSANFSIPTLDRNEIHNRIMDIASKISSKDTKSETEFDVSDFLFSGLGIE